MAERRKIGQPLPAPCAPVTGRDNNGAWYPLLTKMVQRNGTWHREGKEPRQVALKLLTAAGHPPRSATLCIKHYLKDLDFDRNPEIDKGLKRVRELCLKCSSDVLADVTHCAIIQCPLWAHRMGYNPHSRKVSSE